jgi:hypothetical protein
MVANGDFLCLEVSGLAHGKDSKLLDDPDNLNPFIFTPSKPLMSTGSWLTLHNCEIFYLLSVYYDPATTDLIFIRVNIYLGPGEGGSLLTFNPFILSGSLFTLRPYPTILAASLFTQGGGGRGLTG